MTKEQRSVWRKANPELHREEQRKHYAKHKGRVKDRIYSFRKEHPYKEVVHRQRRRTRLTQAGGSFTEQEWFTLCFACGFKCLRCGEELPLTVDHVVPVSKGGTSYLHNIQPLCLACNLKKKAKTVDYRDEISTTILTSDVS